MILILLSCAGNQLAPVQLAGWTFIQGLDSLGGDVHWAWPDANNPVRLAEEACQIDGVIAFNTNGYIKTALRPRAHWTKVGLDSCRLQFRLLVGRITAGCTENQRDAQRIFVLLTSTAVCVCVPSVCVCT